MHMTLLAEMQFPPIHIQDTQRYLLYAGLTPWKSARVCLHYHCKLTKAEWEQFWAGIVHCFLLFPKDHHMHYSGGCAQQANSCPLLIELMHFPSFFTVKEANSNTEKLFHLK